jgi:hypothetical protein
MKYLKRLKNELLDLTDKLDAKCLLPEYVSVKRLHRKEVLVIVIEMIKKARALDLATEYWSSGSSEDWQSFLTNVKHWLGQAPDMPEKCVEKKASAAQPSV